MLTLIRLQNPKFLCEFGAGKELWEAVWRDRSLSQTQVLLHGRGCKSSTPLDGNQSWAKTSSGHGWDGGKMIDWNRFPSDLSHPEWFATSSPIDEKTTRCTKRVLLSKVWGYTGITGIFIFYFSDWKHLILGPLPHNTARAGTSSSAKHVILLHLF